MKGWHKGILLLVGLLLGGVFIVPNQPSSPILATENTSEEQTIVEEVQNRTLQSIGLVIMCSKAFPHRLAGMLSTWLRVLPTESRDRVVFVADDKEALLKELASSNLPSDRWWESRMIEFDDSRGRKMTRRVPFAFKHALDHLPSDVSWFLKLDDDTFVQVHRLERLFNSLKAGELYAGRQRVVKRAHFNWTNPGRDSQPTLTYCEGGAGYAIARPLLDRLIADDFWNRCLRANCPVAAPEDVCTSYCLQILSLDPSSRLFEPSQSPILCHHIPDFHQNFRWDSASESELQRAITVHPTRTTEHIFTAFELLYNDDELV